MSESLIPYSFIPGTKAKAQEVNANFIALADEIQGAKASTTEQLNTLEESITERIETVEENISNNCAGNDLANTGMVTNSILEAPNGTAEFESNTITVKADLKVIIPDGRTEDGKLKNLEYTTEDEITKTITNLSNLSTVLFLYSDGTINCVKQNRIYYKNTTPTTLEDNVHWYNTDENKWYKYVTSESSWQEVQGLPIANVVWDQSSLITSLTAIKPLNLIKASDLNDFYTIRGILPRDLDYIIAHYQSSYSFYILYKSGWIRQGGYVEGSGDSYANFFFPFMAGGYHISLARVSGGGTTSSVPIWLREIQQTYIRIYSSSSTGKIWCAEGFQNTIEEY